MDFGVRKLKNIELNRLTPDTFKIQNNQSVVLLDNVRSMNNVGSIFRTCDCLGINQIYLCGITPVPPHRDIHKTSLGAELSVSWEYAEDIESLLDRLKKENFRLIGLEQTSASQDIRKFVKDTRPMALVLGNEVDGISDSAMRKIEEFFEIPQFGTKHSFNVAVSCGVALWELLIPKNI